MSALLGTNGQLFGWSESTWLWLDQFGILLGDITLIIGVLGGIWAFAQRDRIRRWLRLNRFPLSGRETDPDETWDALIFTVSRAEIPQWVIDCKQPRAIGLLATEESHADAETLANRARAAGVTVIGPRRIDDPDDPAEAREETTRLIQRLRGMGHPRVGVDITGGKTPMSIGAFIAAQEQGCDSLYVSSRYDRKLKRPDTGTARIRRIARAPVRDTGAA